MITKPVLLIRANGNEADAAALDQLGITSVIDPFLQIVAEQDPTGAAELLDAVISATDQTWIIATSLNAVNYWSHLVGVEELKAAFKKENLSFAAVGKSTAARLTNLGASSVMTGAAETSIGLLALLANQKPATAVIPSGNLAMKVLPSGLRQLGWNAISKMVYQNSIVTTEPASVLQISQGEFGAIVLRSPSAVRALVRFLPLLTTPLICGGPTTANELAKFNLPAAAVAQSPSAQELALLVKEVLQSHE